MPSKVGLLTVPVGFPVTDTLPLSPVNVGWLTLPAGVNLPVLVIAEPVNFSSAPVPVKDGWVEVALLMPVAIVCAAKVGMVTAVGVFAVNDPAVQPMVSTSLATDVVNTGRVQDAAFPAVTAPPPVALPATYLLTVFGVTVMVGVETEPSGV